MSDRWWCRLCEEEKATHYCDVHPAEDLPAVRVDTAPKNQAADQSERPRGDERVGDRAEDTRPTQCWSCGHRQTDVRNDICEQCKESLMPPLLVIAFPEGKVVLRDRDTSVDLGRAGEYGRLFAAHPNVSRRHANVSVDADGDAWITPYPQAPNGTFVNDVEITEKQRVQPDARIRFATDREPPVSAPIRQPYREG